MVNTEATTPQIVLYEGNGAQPIEDGRRFEILCGLLDRGYAVARAGDPRNGGPRFGVNPPSGKRLLVLGDFAGQAPDLEDANGQYEIDARDLGDLDAEGVTEMVESWRNGSPMNQPGQWKPWFPVIDYDRCTNCMQCLSFCLFDVYGVDDDHRIQVQNNDNCKTNCPACSRVCPEVAIMFPKYASGPINGDQVSDTDVQREKMKVDITALLGGDIYSRLKDRSEAAKSRFSKERSPDKALNERKRCLNKLQKDGIIPAEVMAEIDLASLPSPEEIQKKAQDAAARAQAALDAAASKS